ncbi:MAG: ribonuclease Z [Cyclobacteriaceae bacterium]|nr:ribonuclease Z [Cyclobacteriaceae bacterium]
MSFAITILGSSGALPQHGRYTSAQWLEIEGTHMLIDCGEAAQMQIKRYDLSLSKIDYIFISHLHGDHYLGLPGVLFTLHLLKRTKPLHIFGLQGLDEIITIQLKYSKSHLNYPLFFHTLNPEKTTDLILDEDKFTVTSFPLNHKIPTCGFLFKEKIKPYRIDKDKLNKEVSLQAIAQFRQGNDFMLEGGKILAYQDYTLPPKRSRNYAYCSDTAYHLPIVETIKEVDLLYHEATFINEDLDKAIETKHSTALQAAEIAKKANVKKLLLGHFSARYKDLQVIEAEAKTIYPHSALAIDGETFTIEE